MTDPADNPKLHAEWFWTDRWQGSSAFLLPIEHRGLYREMLTAAWRRGCRLPNDHEAIRRACGVTLEEWERCWPRIEKYWRVDGDDLVNDTQIEIYEQNLAKHVSAVERGKKGSAARWGKPQLVAKPIAKLSPKHLLEQSPPDPDPEVRTYSGGAEQAVPADLAPSPPPEAPPAPPPPLAYDRRRQAPVFPGGAHRSCATCFGPVCLPSALYTEFKAKLGDDEVKLQAWLDAVKVEWGAKVASGLVIGDDNFAFWRFRFAERFGTTKPPARQEDRGRISSTSADTRAEMAARTKEQAAIDADVAHRKAHGLPPRSALMHTTQETTH